MTTTKEIVTVTGKNYGTDLLKAYNTNPCFLSVLDGRNAAILVCSQYGWENGCQEKDHKILINPKYVETKSQGSPMSVGRIQVECDEIIDPIPLVDGDKYLLKYDPARGQIYGFDELVEALKDRQEGETNK